MNITRRHFFSFFLTICCLLLVNRANAAGDAVKYPEDAPLLTFTVPAGWEHGQGKDAPGFMFLASPTSDDDTSLILSFFERVDLDEAAVLSILPTVCLKTAAEHKVVDPAVGQATKENFGSGISSIKCTANGTLNGKPTVVGLRWFKIGNRTLMIIQITSQSAKYSQAFGSILASFKPAR